MDPNFFLPSNHYTLGVGPNFFSEDAPSPSPTYDPFAMGETNDRYDLYDLENLDESEVATSTSMKRTSNPSEDFLMHPALEKRQRTDPHNSIESPSSRNDGEIDERSDESARSSQLPIFKELGERITAAASPMTAEIRLELYQQAEATSRAIQFNKKTGPGCPIAGCLCVSKAQNKFVWLEHINSKHIKHPSHLCNLCNSISYGPRTLLHHQRYTHPDSHKTRSNGSGTHILAPPTEEALQLETLVAESPETPSVPIFHLLTLNELGEQLQELAGTMTEQTRFDLYQQAEAISHTLKFNKTIRPGCPIVDCSCAKKVRDQFEWLERINSRHIQHPSNLCDRCTLNFYGPQSQRNHRCQGSHTTSTPPFHPLTFQELGERLTALADTMTEETRLDLYQQAQAISHTIQFNKRIGPGCPIAGCSCASKVRDQFEWLERINTRHIRHPSHLCDLCDRINYGPNSAREHKRMKHPEMRMLANNSEIFLSESPKIARDKRQRTGRRNTINSASPRRNGEIDEMDHESANIKMLHKKPQDSLQL